MTASLLAVLIALPFVAISLLGFNLWKLAQMIRERIEAEGFLTR